ncbi:hypothetical protein ACFWN1_20110 [Streptomyces sp. NPDC058459]|uniref:hypothetical protein n=1 Tax=Streptomyces sp. NPDC058459 TaxID=3346508 RepID=UPI003664B4F1
MSHESDAQWSDPVSHVVMMTVELAAELLSRENFNRRLNRGHVATLAASMVRGHWQVTHQGIALDGPLATGSVIDGQHRLHAVVEAGVAVPMLVFEHVSRDTFRVLDTGQRRTAADALSLKGESNSQLLASTVRHVHLYLNVPVGQWIGPKARMTNDQILEALEKDPDGYREAAAVGRKLGPKALIIPTAAAVGYYVTVDGSTPRTRVDEWLSGVASGANLSGGDPRLALCRTLINARGRGNQRRRSTRAQSGLYVKAWNHWMEGDEITELKMAKNQRLPKPFRLETSPEKDDH